MAEPWPNPWAGLAQGVARGYKEGQQMSLLRRQQETQERQQKLAGAMTSMKNGMELLAAKNPATRKIGFELIRQVAKNNPELGYNLDNINLDENQITHDAVTEFAKNSLESMKLFEGGKLQPQDLDKTLRESYGRAFEELRKADDEDSIKRMDKIMESRRGGAAGKLASDITFYQPYSGERGAGSPTAAQGVKDFQQGLLSSMSLFDPEAAQKKENAMLRREQESGIMERNERVGIKNMGYDANGNPIYDVPRQMRQETGQGTGDMPLPGITKTPPSLQKEANFHKSAMQRLENLAKYYKPEYVGIVQGRIANPERKLASLPPEQVKFYREFKQLNDDIIRSKEGAVVPEAMVKRLEQFMNDIKQPSGNFEAQYDSLTDYVRDQMKNLNETTTTQRTMTPFTARQAAFWTNRESLLRGKPAAKVPAPAGASGDGKNNDPLGIR